MISLLSALFIALGAVGVTSAGDLKLELAEPKQAVAEWSAQHIGAGIPSPRLTTLPQDLKLVLTQITLPKITGFSSILEGYLHRELKRGWLVTGRLKRGKGQSRSVRFTRSNPEAKLSWTDRGRAKPVACGAQYTGADVLGCYHVTPVSGHQVALALGPSGTLRLTPHALLVMSQNSAGVLHADVHTMVLLRPQDADAVKVPKGELGDNPLGPLSMIMKAAMGGGNGVWRIEGRTRFAVKSALPRR